MQSGYHDHFCKTCGHGFVCPIVTHCKAPFETACPDHLSDLVTSWVEENFLDTGKWPGEK